MIALLCGILRSYLPSVKLRELDDTLEETEGLFQDAQEQGLLTDASFVTVTRQHLSALRDRTLLVRSDVHAATTPIQQFHQMSKGLSLAISVICRDVKNVRSIISTSSAEARLRLREERTRSSVPPALYTFVPPDCVPNSNTTNVTDNVHPTPLPVHMTETEAEPRMLGRVVTFTSDTITLNNDSDDDGHKDVLRNATAIRSAALCLSMSDGKLPISDSSTVAAPNCTRDNGMRLKLLLCSPSHSYISIIPSAIVMNMQSLFTVAPIYGSYLTVLIFSSYPIHQFSTVTLQHPLHPLVHLINLTHPTITIPGRLACISSSSIR
ncbi:hypothetical protein EW146_g7035 [Bondarzewia mesenterica]|uniref:Uncharacterized protein n=1 Tax=Bondarzewia mesenterica TaxID=1095465 RepID=A0A4S4LLW4_9AGAM|nr:hypothetical protein EW146_g7035 [Bondarzewia mesenterica]